jgi:UDP-N-acetylmuramoylalanine-D-glutamate ligase
MDAATDRKMWNASFDMFSDFTHRGRVFIETVEALR